MFCASGACSGAHIRPETTAERQQKASGGEKLPAGTSSSREEEKKSAGEGVSSSALRSASRLCVENSSECKALLSVEAALNRGELEEAKQAIVVIRSQGRPSLSPLGHVALLVLEGRTLLESDSLSYGAGGEDSLLGLKKEESALTLLGESRGERGGSALYHEALLQKSRALLALGEGKLALVELKTVERAEPEVAEVQGALGIAYISVGQTRNSLRHLELAVSLDTQEPQRLIVLGTAQMLLGELAQAERSFRGAIHLDGASPRAHGNLGSVLLLRGEFQAGRQHLERASRLAPGQATYLSNLSYAELLLDKPTLSLRWAKSSLKLDPRLASAWLNQGLAQVALGDRQSARASFEKAHQLDPTDPRPRNNLQDLDELEKAK